MSLKRTRMEVKAPLRPWMEPSGRPWTVLLQRDLKSLPSVSLRSEFVFELFRRLRGMFFQVIRQDGSGSQVSSRERGIVSGVSVNAKHREAQEAVSPLRRGILAGALVPRRIREVHVTPYFSSIGGHFKKGPRLLLRFIDPNRTPS